MQFVLQNPCPRRTPENCYYQQNILGIDIGREIYVAKSGPYVITIKVEFCNLRIVVLEPGTHACSACSSSYQYSGVKAYQRIHKLIYLS